MEDPMGSLNYKDGISILKIVLGAVGFRAP